MKFPLRHCSSPCALSVKSAIHVTLGSIWGVPVMRESIPAASTPDTQLFRDVFNASPIGIVVENLEGQPLFVNPAFCSFLGFTQEELQNKHCVDFSPPEDAQKDWELFQQLRAGSIDHYQLEKRYFRRDGSLVWGRLSLSLVNGRSSPLILAMVENITDKKTAEEALRTSEERLRLAQQAAGIGTFEVDFRTGMNTWTPELEAMYGLPPGGFAGSQAAFKQLVHPEDRQRVSDLDDTAMQSGQPIQGEWRVVWPDGSVHWIAGRWQVLMNQSGEPSRMIGVNLDVTERKLREEKLREYERAVECSGEMIIVLDRNYRYLIANRQYLKMRKLAKEKVVGHLAREILGEDYFRALVKPKLDECFQGRVIKYETKYSYPAKGERDLLISYFPIYGATGIDGAACILHDITNRKQAEEALAGMSRKLIEAQEQERTRIARELHDDISQRLALLGVEIDAAKSNAPNCVEDVNRLLNEVQQRLVEVSSEVQSISHQLHSSQLEYLGIVAAMRSFCKEFAARQKVEIEFTHDEIPKTVPYEVSLCLFRVLQEAVHNAAKHSHGRQFKVRLGCSGSELQFTVTDRGSGFDIERAMNTGGLGLTSMRERVRMVNGTISIESKATQGTSIHVRVPLDSAAASERAAG